MTIEWSVFLSGFVFGAIIGAAYFYVLWRSVRMIAIGRFPLRAGLIGAVIRLTLLFGSFLVFLPSGPQPEAIIGWLAGFLLVRIASTGRARLDEKGR